MMPKAVNGNYVMVALLVMTAVMQANVLYRQRHSGTPSARQVMRKAPDGTMVDVRGMPFLGAESAPVVLVEFSDYECPFCQKHATSVFSELKKEFVSTGRMRYVFANNPLAMHRNAVFLASAALCAGDQGKYWPLHDLLFEKQVKTLPELLPLVGDKEIDLETFERCASDESNHKRVQKDVQVAQRLGLLGTPGFAVGRPRADGQIVIDTLISGAQPFATFRDIVKKML